MNFTSYSQIEEAYSNLQSDILIHDNINLFSEMHNYISENVVELPYEVELFTEAKDGKNFLERIWDMIVGIWNAIKKFVSIIFRSIRQLFTGKSENDKLIEKLENNSEDIADSIQNKPAAEVVKVLTELFVSEKKSEEKSPEVKKESAYLSEGNTSNYINKIKNTIDVLYKKMPKNISFADFIKDKQNEQMVLKILNQIGKSYNISEKTSISSSLVKLIEARLKANGLILDAVDFIFSEEMEKQWDGYFQSLAFKGKRSGFNPNDKNKQSLFLNTITDNKALINLVQKDSDIKKRFKYLTFDWVQNTSMKNDYLEVIHYSDLEKAFNTRLRLQFAYNDILSIIYILENCETIISYNKDDFTNDPGDFSYYFGIDPKLEIINWIYDRIHTHTHQIVPLDFEKISSFAQNKKISISTLNIDIAKYKKITYEKIKPVSNKDTEFSYYKTDIDFFKQNGPSKFTTNKMYRLPDSLINAKGSMRYIVSNSLNYYIKLYSDQLKILNSFRNKINLYSLKKQALKNLEQIAFVKNGMNNKYED